MCAIFGLVIASACSFQCSNGGVDDPTFSDADSDRDAHKDVIMLAIKKRSPDDEAKQEALMAVANALEQALTAGASGDLAACLEASESIIGAVRQLHDHTERPEVEVRWIEGVVVNTRVRKAAYRDFNSKLNGQFFQ